MAEIKWIKITTDIFDDDKILLIESLPDADSIIVIWFKLLCLAGKQNNSGVFLLNDRIPYTDKMLATIFRRKETTVHLALETFENFGMIEVVDGVITIPNWGKHQNLDAIEKKTEYMRGYMRNYREKQKQIAASSSSDACKTNSKSNVSRADKNRLDKSKEEDIPPLPPCEAEKQIEIPFHGDLLNAFSDWIAYKKEKRQPYKPRGLKALISQVQSCADEYGDAAVAEVIRNSMASNYQGIILDSLKHASAGKTKGRKMVSVMDIDLRSETVYDADATEVEGSVLL